MKTNYLSNFFIIVALAVFTGGALAQQNEFSISGNSNNSIIGGVAFDGSNYLAGLTGDATNDSNVTAQRISVTGQLLGNRIVLGETGSPPLAAFDGTNYLLVWGDRYVRFLDDGEDAGFTNIYGRLVDPSGNFAGNRFTIAANAYIKGVTCGSLLFNGTDYFLIYRGDNGMGDVGPVYGQRISTGGSLQGSKVQISPGDVGDVAMAFDGSNYLVVYTVNSKEVRGQFVSSLGSLLGSEFAIDNSSNASDNPLSVAFDGSRYLVAFHDDDPVSSDWNLYARFVSKAGLVDAAQVLICHPAEKPLIPTLAFDGNNYLAAWISLGTKEIRGKFIAKDGSQNGAEFVIFGALSDVLPIGGVASFSGSKYLSICTRISWTKRQEEGSAANLGIYGKFLDKSSPTSLRNIHQNVVAPLIYPNPVSRILNVVTGEQGGRVALYNLLGELVMRGEAEGVSLWLDVSGLPEGIYLLKTGSDEAMTSRKIMIRK